MLPRASVRGDNLLERLFKILRRFGRSYLARHFQEAFMALSICEFRVRSASAGISAERRRSRMKRAPASYAGTERSSPTNPCEDR